LLGERAPEEADLGELRDDAGVHPLRPIPVACVRDDLAVAERAGGLTDQLLLVGEVEVHGRVLSRTCHRSRARSRSSRAPAAASAAHTRWHWPTRARL